MYRASSCVPRTPFLWLPSQAPKEGTKELPVSRRTDTEALQLMQLCPTRRCRRSRASPLQEQKQALPEARNRDGPRGP